MLLHLLLGSFLIASALGAEEVCPFSNKCTCTKEDGADARTFATVLCTDAILLTLNFGSPNPKYIVTGTMRIEGDMTRSTLDQFGAFARIADLVLVQSPTGESQNWVARTFNGPTIQAIAITGLNRVQLGADLKLDGLQKLSISKSDSFRISKSLGETYPELTSIKIDGTTVTVDDDGLDGMPKLETLSLTSASLTDIPTRALQAPKNLKNLHLDKNQIPQIPSKAFSELTKLVVLTLANNPVATLTKSAFTALTALEDVDLSSTNLEKIDLADFEKSEELLMLKFDSCQSLKSVTFSGKASEYPEYVAISIKSTTLTTLDSKLGDLMNAKPAISITIEDSQSLQCDQKLKWMIPEVICTMSISIEDTRCATPEVYKDKGLDEFFFEIEPNPPCPDQPQTSTVPPVTGTNAGTTKAYSLMPMFISMVMTLI